MVAANIDSDGTRYIAKATSQLGRQEMIVDLCMMANVCSNIYASYLCMAHFQPIWAIEMAWRKS